jgi:hypothetical protein
MHPARQQCNARTPKYLVKLSTCYIVFPENLTVAEIFPNFIHLMFKHPVHRSLSVDPLFSQFSPVHSFIPRFSEMHLRVQQGLVYDCSSISGPQNVPRSSFVCYHLFGYVTYRRVLNWWPDLLHTYTAYYYTSQITIWHTVSYPSSSIAISRDPLSFDSSWPGIPVIYFLGGPREDTVCIVFPTIPLLL